MPTNFQPVKSTLSIVPGHWKFGTCFLFKICFLLFVFFNLQTSAPGQLNHGLPYIHNYSPAEYGAGTDNWAILQDKRGIMYFGNNPGVLEYDGSRWRNIPVSNQSLVRSLAMDSLGIIYVGAVGEFGYLAPDKNGGLMYHSLLDKIPDECREFADVWKTYFTSSGIFFQTFDYLFLYTGKEIKVFYPSNSFHFSFYVNDNFFITDRGKGLMTVKNDSLVLAANGEFFSDKRIYTLLPYGKDTLLAATREKGIFLISTGENPSVTPFINEADAYFHQNQVYHGTVLNDNSFAIATLRGGVVLLSRSGRLKGILNKENGIQNENVKYVYEDAEGGVWMALDDGISRAEIGSPARIFTDISGVKGAISDIEKYNNTLYIATTQGIFSFKNKEEETAVPGNYGGEKLQNPEDVQKLVKCFYPVGNINSQGWDLLKTTQGTLLAATTDGIFRISEKEIVPVNREYSFKLYQSKKFPDRVFVGTQYGIFSILYRNGAWADEGKLEGADSEIRSITEDEDGNLFLGMPFVGVARLRFCHDCSSGKDTVYETSWKQKYVVERFDTSSGLPNLRWNTVFESSGTVFIGTDKGLYSFKQAEKKFLPDPRFGKQFADGSCQVYCFLQQNDDHWIYTASSKDRELSLIRSGEIISKPFKRFYEHEIHALFPEDSTRLWLGSANGLISYQHQNLKNFELPYQALIRKVITGKDSVIFSGNNFSVISSGDSTAFVPAFAQPEELVLSLPFSLNSMAFEFAAASYDNEASNRFRWFLEGYDNDWSKWSNEPKTHYTNLKEGNYKFHLQSKNIYETEGKEAVYEFSILPPWYRTITAYVFYLFLLVGLIYASVKISVRRLEQAKIRLENIVTERTAEVVKQKEKIESQNHQLEHKNKEITDSINYARRIQEAILPGEGYLKKMFSPTVPAFRGENNKVTGREASGGVSHFVLFKPKDIVSGDFFWTYHTPDNKLIWAAVDCTGHGVPGAFMSMIGNSLLNEIVVENKINNPDEILNNLREAVIKALRQTGEAGKQKDGMDIALCVLDRAVPGGDRAGNGEAKSAGILQFSGANNPLWLIRGKELITHKPDKQPIGYYSEQMKPFTKQEILLQEGDLLYTFTDGYEDQFGGPKKKKFRAKQFRELLLSIRTKPMDEQKEILDTAIINWMGTEEQIDDICVFGVRV